MKKPSYSCDIFSTTVAYGRDEEKQVQGANGHHGRYDQQFDQQCEAIVTAPQLGNVIDIVPGIIQARQQDHCQRHSRYAGESGCASDCPGQG